MNPSPLPYRPNVCLMILDNRSNFFVARRAGTEDIWQLPQGGIDTTEDVSTAALREASEELGAARENFQLITILDAVHCYDFPEPLRYGKSYFRGQKQHYALLRFTGTDADINLSAGGNPPELDEYCWCSEALMLERVEPKRRAGYQKALSELADRAELLR